MTRKIPFSKLQRTCPACPSQWEIVFDDKCGCLINYHDDHLQVYISQSPVTETIRCISAENLVLSIEDLLQTPFCGYMKDDVLFEILSAYDLLEKE